MLLLGNSTNEDKGVVTRKNVGRGEAIPIFAESPSPLRLNELTGLSDHGDQRRECSQTENIVTVLQLIRSMN